MMNRLFTLSTLAWRYCSRLLMLLSLVLIVGSYSDVSAQCAGSGYNQGNVALSTAMTCDPAQVGPVSTTYGTCLAAAGGCKRPVHRAIAL